jgi:hypothetical protein
MYCLKIQIKHLFLNNEFIFVWVVVFLWPPKNNLPPTSQFQGNWRTLHKMGIIWCNSAHFQKSLTQTSNQNLKFN